MCFFSEQNPQQGQENRDPLPNPWGGSTGTNQSDPSNVRAAPTSGNLPTGGTGGTMFNGDTMNSMMQQMIENPQVMQSIMNTPYFQSTLQAMTSNPNMASNLLSNNPLLANNPELQVRKQYIFVIIVKNIYNLIKEKSFSF